MKNINSLVKNMIIFGKKVLAGANLVALTIAITPDNVAAQNLDNKPQKQAYTKDKENLATNIQNIVNNLLPNTSDCFEYDPKICRFESEYPSESEGNVAISQIKQDLSGLGCRMSLNRNGCEGEDSKICQMIWWECPQGKKVRSIMYIRTK